MDKEKASKDIMGLFLRIVRTYNSMEKLPAKHGSKHELYHSERHILDVIGDNPAMNVSELAAVIGVTKGAISQVVRKLESKGLVQRFKKSTNDKEVFIELTKAGRDIHHQRGQTNRDTLLPLVEELKRHPDDKVAFLVSMFRWLDAYMDSSKKSMLGHGKTGK